MFVFLIILISALTFGSCGGASSGQRYISSQSKIERLNHSVVALVRPTQDVSREMGLLTRTEQDTTNTMGEQHDSYCSGFWVSNYEVITAAHCVQRTRVIQTIFGPMSFPVDESPVGDLKKVTTYASWRAANHELKSYKIFEVTSFNKDRDLALLTLGVAQVPPSYFVSLRLGSEPRTGERVYALGHPAGQPWTLTEGIVSHPIRQRRNGGLYTQASAQVFFGNSGGPLINNRGEAIGVASGIIAPHLAFFVHVKALRNFIDGR